MKPFKSGAVIAAWLFRILLVWFAYKNYFQTFTDFEFKSFDVYIATAYLLFTLLVVAGGILQNEALTVFTGLVIFVLPVVQLIRALPGDWSDVLFLYLIPLSVGFFFFSNGND